jgi:hypothetical protein
VVDNVGAGSAAVELQIEPYRYSASWLIGASTHAIDRFIPDVERIFQPEGQHIGGTITFRLDPLASLIHAPRGSWRRRMVNRVRHLPPTDLGETICFDVRENGYFNWSHQVNYFLTLALAARSRIEQGVTIILPKRLPAIASALYQKFGFDVISTDGPVRGRNYFWSVTHTQVVHSGRQQLIAPFMAKFGQNLVPRLDLPPRIFLSRRGTRSLLNEGEIETLLSARGFIKVYAEDLTLDEQFAMWRQATDVVAIHGAGMAPMQYRPHDAPALRLVELAPVGLMTRWFGLMCEQVGGKYIAVRARILPQYVEALYNPAPFLKNCDDNFAIDPRSLEVALETIAKGEPTGCATELFGPP